MHRSRPWIALTLLLTACTPQATQPTVPPAEAPLQRLIDQRIATPIDRGVGEAEPQPFTSEEAEAIFQLLDSDGDGTIQATEWSARVPDGSSAVLDADSDELITREEFRSFALTPPEEPQPTSRGEAIAPAPELSDETFDERVLKTDRLAVVVFTADWSGPCRVFRPAVQEAFQKYDIAGGTINVDQNQQVAARYHLRAIPYVLFFKDGQESFGYRLVGPVPASTLHRRIEMLLKE